MDDQIGEEATPDTAPEDTAAEGTASAGTAAEGTVAAQDAVTAEGIPTAEGTAEGTAPAEDRPLVDLRPALGLAGHEVEELGLEGIPDTGEVLYATEERTNAVQHPTDHLESDIATRGLRGH